MNSIAAGSFVIPGGNAPVLLDPGKEVLDPMAPLVGFPVVGAPLFAFALGEITAVALPLCPRDSVLVAGGSAPDCPERPTSAPIFVVSPPQECPMDWC